MRKVKSWSRYFFWMLMVFFMISLWNMIAVFMVSLSYKDSREAFRLNYVLEGFQYSDGECTLSSDIAEEMKNLGEFAFFINEEGQVVWKEQCPKEIPDYFSGKEIASFTRWYLEDYPVYVNIQEEGIFVLGEPKDSVWKYLLLFDIREINRIVHVLPVIVLMDILILVGAPFGILNFLQKKEERERVEWIAGISHDIRTPLAILIGNTETLLDKEYHKEEARKLESIRNQGLRIKDLVANLNTENRLRYGRKKKRKDFVKIAELLRDVCCEMANREDEDLFELSCYVEEQLEEKILYAEESFIRRMLENLIGNAMRHNPQGCEIYISLKETGKDRRYPLELVVQDKGKGADEETLKRISGKRRMKEIKEHGMGLRIVREIAEFYGWKIEFGSKPGEGFFCVLKIKESILLKNKQKFKI